MGIRRGRFRTDNRAGRLTVVLLTMFFFILCAAENGDSIQSVPSEHAYGKLPQVGDSHTQMPYMLKEGTALSIEEQNKYLERIGQFDNICEYIKQDNAIYGITDTEEAVLVSMYSEYSEEQETCTLTIPERAGNYPVVGIAEWAVDVEEEITDIEFPDSLRVLADHAISTEGEAGGIPFNVPEALISVENSSIAELPEEWEKENPGDMLIVGNCLISCESRNRILTIPEGVEIISKNALTWCEAEILVLPQSIKEVYSVPPQMKEMNIPKKLVLLADVSQTPWFSNMKEEVKGGMIIMNGVLLYEGTAGEEMTVPEGVWMISGAFRNNDTVRKVYLPDSVRLLYHAFTYCSALHEIILPDSVEEICEYSFRNCEALESVVFGNGLRQIRKGAFFRCEALKQIEFPNSLKGIGDYSFRECVSLEKVSIPGSVLTLGNEVFYECSSMQRLVLSEGIKRIGKYAFFSCTSLTEIIVPDSVEYLRKYAFFNCVGVKHFHFGDGVRFMESAIFGTGYDYEIPFEVRIELPETMPELTVPGREHRWVPASQFGMWEKRSNIAYIVYPDSDGEEWAEHFAEGEIYYYDE